MLIKEIDKEKFEIIITIKDLNKYHISIYDFLSSPTFSITKLLKSNFGSVYKNIKLDIIYISNINIFIVRFTNLFYTISKKQFKNLKLNTHFLVKFKNFEMLCYYCNSTSSNFTSSLYLYNNSYYLNIKIKNIFEYRYFYFTLKEFTKDYKINYFLNENAKIIIKKNAIEVCRRYFVT